MGIAKSIEAFTIYDFYTTEINHFTRDLSNKLNADFIINIFDENFNPIEKKKSIQALIKLHNINLQFF